MDHTTLVEHATPATALTDIAFVAALAGLLGLGLMRLKQPPLVGFIIAGMVLGPTGFGIIHSSAYVQVLAEMGVLVLLFFIGIELSLRAFVLTIRQALLVAGGQLLAALAVGMLLGYLIGSDVAESLVLGFIIALSSTVVAMKMLDDMGLLRSEEGRVAIAVLIAQDLAVIPMLVFVSSFGGDDVSYSMVTFKILVAVAVLGGLLWWLGRRGKLRFPFTEQIENNVEILALGSLAVCFSAASISSIAGLSPVYGAFIAGILIGNSTLRSRVIPVIEPIQSVLLVIFFLSIGLLIDLWFIWDNLWFVLITCLVVITAKSLLNIALLRLTGADPRTALVSGLSMAQIGEFSFVLAAAGLGASILHEDTYRLAIAVTAISLLLSPVWASLMHRVQDVAQKGLTTYREALREAYAHEIEEVQRGRQVIDAAVFHVRLRYRAVRLAVYHRKALKATKAAEQAEQMASQEAGPDVPEEQAPEPVLEKQSQA